MGGKNPRMRILCNKKNKRIFEEDWQNWCWEYWAYNPILYDLSRMKKSEMRVLTFCSGEEE